MPRNQVHLLTRRAGAVRVPHRRVDGILRRAWRFGLWLSTASVAGGSLAGCFLLPSSPPVSPDQVSAWQAQIPATIERELRESEQRGERLRQVEEKVQALIRGGAQHWRVQHADRAAVLAQGIELSDIAVLLGPFDILYVKYRGTADCPQLLVIDIMNLTFLFDRACVLETVHHHPRPR